MSHDDHKELLLAAVIYMVSQVATVYCAYQHFLLGSLISWLIGLWWVSAAVNKPMPPIDPNEPPSPPPTDPPNYYRGGPRSGF